MCLVVDYYNFERMMNFMYINENSDSHEEIKLRLIAVNRCCFGLIPLLSQYLLWRTKITLHKVLVRPIEGYYMRVATTKTDEVELVKIERKILRRIFGLKRIRYKDKPRNRRTVRRNKYCWSPAEVVG